MGSSAVPPAKLWPFCTVSRLVPSAAISAFSPAERDADKPEHGHDRRHPDRDAQRRQRGPQLAGAQADRGQPGQVGRPAAGPAPGRAGHGPRSRKPMARSPATVAFRGVGDDLPSSISTWRCIRSATCWLWVTTTMVVAGLVELAEQVQDRRAGGLVQVAGGLVGQHDRGLPGDRPGDRHPLPLPAGQLGGPGRAACGPARPAPARRAACSRRPARPTPAYSSPSATLSSTVWCSARKNCWNTNPIRPARSPASSRSLRLPTSSPATLTVPAVGMVQGAGQV